MFSDTLCVYVSIFWKTFRRTTYKDLVRFLVTVKDVQKYDASPLIT